MFRLDESEVHITLQLALTDSCKTNTYVQDVEVVECSVEYCHGVQKGEHNIFLMCSTVVHCDNIKKPMGTVHKLSLYLLYWSMATLNDYLRK
jgi:hypothetical protein